ncbi:glutaredoxin family protein [Candidatus Bathyarchaeota archaeon]|jgi:glutaredoxin|nr:glutaredoxin family protein [Candidatus Bathyarchaeota archaeon]
MNSKKIEGKNKKHKVFLYTLSTCVWCKRTKQFLRDNNIQYEYVDLDLTDAEDREKAKQDIQKKGGRLSFPAIIIDDDKMINGFQKESLSEALGI